MRLVDVAGTAAGSAQAGAARAASGSGPGPKGKRLAWRRPRVRPYQKHGLVSLRRASLRRAVDALGGRLLDGRSTMAKALSAWRAELVRDLGGADVVSTQELALVDLAVRTKLLVDSVDTYVLSMESAVNKKRRCLWPVVRERQALAAQLQSILRDLGLRRRAVDGGDATRALLEVKRLREAAAETARDAAGADGRRTAESSEGAASPPAASGLHEAPAPPTSVPDRDVDPGPLPG